MKNIVFQSMSLEEYAEYALKNGIKLEKINGIWWRVVRPFFYRPLFPFQALIPGTYNIPLKSNMGGLQHVVTDPSLSNSYINFLVFKDVHEYSLGTLTRNHRKNIKKASQILEVKPITNLGDFTKYGYKIYLSSFKRTGYTWKKELQNKTAFEKWAKYIFNNKKIYLIGAYNNNLLFAFSIFYLLEDIFFYDIALYSTEHIRLRPAELLLHHIRLYASNYKNLKYIFMGSFGYRKELDYFKLSRGCIILSKYAFLRVNTFSKFLLAAFRKDLHNRLLGMDEKQAYIYQRHILNGQSKLRENGLDTHDTK